MAVPALFAKATAVFHAPRQYRERVEGEWTTTARLLQQDGLLIVMQELADKCSDPKWQEGRVVITTEHKIMTVKLPLKEMLAAVNNPDFLRGVPAEQREEFEQMPMEIPVQCGRFVAFLL